MKDENLVFGFKSTSSLSYCLYYPSQMALTTQIAKFNTENQVKNEIYKRFTGLQRSEFR